MKNACLIFLTVIALIVSGFARKGHATGIVDVEPTPFFPRVNAGAPLRQEALLSINGTQATVRTKDGKEVSGVRFQDTDT